MVQNLRSLERKLLVKIPQAVERNLRTEMEKHARRIVILARRLAPFKDGDLRASIGWVWGTEVPEGAISLGQVGGEDGSLVITIFAGNDKAFYARFIEFGTQKHSLSRNASVSRGLRQDQGTQHKGIDAQPFFFPAYRLTRRNMKAGMTRAIKKGLREGAR